MAWNPRTRLYSLLILLFVLFLAIFSLSPQIPNSIIPLSLHPGHVFGNDPSPDSLALTGAECSRAFPGLTKEVDDAVALGSFQLPFGDGPVMQAKVVSGQLRVLWAPGKHDLSDTMRHRQLTTLHQIHRALTTSPEPIPDTPFAFSVKDIPLPDTMSYARSVTSPSHRRIWPMPHFAFWSWPLPFLDSIPAVARAVAVAEAGLPFHDKDPRAVWRGTAWFKNGAGSNPRLRQELVLAAAGKPWADVQPLNWTTNSGNASNAIRIDDFCQYKYIIQTEGIGYSGRLQYHQLCESVLLTPALEWMQHTTHLIRPVFSSTIIGPGPSAGKHPTGRVLRAWPTEFPLDEANAIFVAGDWSDLGAMVQWLEENPEAAAGVARRQRQTFADRQYLSVSAEVCYWRALLKGWRQVVEPVGPGWNQTGTRFEDFATIGELQDQH
jgi:hypothetical protein